MKKYIREILLGILFILCVITIYLLIQQKNRTDEMEQKYIQILAVNQEQLEESKRNLAQNKIVLDSLMTVIAQSENTIIIDKQEYEKTKKSSRKTNYTSTDIVNFLKGYGYRPNNNSK